MICKSLILLAHIHSFHYDSELNYNNQTPGVAAECRGSDFSVAGGYYNNSFDDPSFYVAAGWSAIENEWLLVGPVLGAANGYGEDRTLRGCLADGRCGQATYTPNSDYVPLAGVRVVAKYGRAEFSTLWTPHFDDFNPGVVSLALGWRFGR